jgi:hypothetical protein
MGIKIRRCDLRKTPPIVGLSSEGKVRHLVDAFVDHGYITTGLRQAMHLNELALFLYAVILDIKPKGVEEFCTRMRKYPPKENEVSFLNLFETLLKDPETLKHIEFYTNSDRVEVIWKYNVPSKFNGLDVRGKKADRIVRMNAQQFAMLHTWLITPPQDSSKFSPEMYQEYGKTFEEMMV